LITEVSRVSFPVETGTTQKTQPTGFSGALAKALDQVQGLETQADTAAQELVKGTASDIHQVVIASEKATLGLQLAIAVRNKVLEAYSEIMRMQV
jgi:flagellar hook-basal body complex protein FliE